MTFGLGRLSAPVVAFLSWASPPHIIMLLVNRKRLAVRCFILKRGNCHGVVVFVVVCLCTWHCVLVLRHGTTKSSSIAMQLVFKATCWCYLGIEMGLEIMLVLCCQLNTRCGNHTAEWLLQMTGRTLCFSFMMKISLLIMVNRDQLPWQQNHQDLAAALMTSVFSQAKVSPALSCHHIGPDLRRTYSYLCSSPYPRLPIWKTSCKPTWDQSTILIQQAKPNNRWT